MTINYVLIDYENVQVKSLALLRGEHFRVQVFLGPKNLKLHRELVFAMQTFGARGKYVELEAGGKIKERANVVRAVTETHVELVLIHPFREGNGRAARVLAILMALQAGLPMLNFTPIAEESKQDYFAAVQAGLDRNYEPMGRLFARIIELSSAF